MGGCGFMAADCLPDSDVAGLSIAEQIGWRVRVGSLGMHVASRLLLESSIAFDPQIIHRND